VCCGGARGAHWPQQLHHLLSASRRPASGPGRVWGGGALGARTASQASTNPSSELCGLPCGIRLRPGVRRRREGSLASTTPSSALCGPPPGIRFRPGVGLRRTGSSLASTTPSSALCGPPSGIRLRPGVRRRRGGSSPASRTPYAPLGRPHGPIGATNVRADSSVRCCYTRLPAAGTAACCYDHPLPPSTHHSKRSPPHPTPPHPTGWPVNATAVEPARQRMDLQAARYWMGPCDLATPWGPRPASQPPISLAHNNLHPPSPLMGDPSPALSDRFYFFCGHRLAPPPKGRGEEGALVVRADAGFPYGGLVHQNAEQALSPVLHILKR
jgi:hypothetical protein